MMDRIRDGLRRGLQAWLRLSPTVQWRLVLSAAVLGLLIWMAVSAKPWTIEFPEESKPRLADVVKFYAWWAAGINCVVLGLLAIICPWWAGRNLESAPRPQIGERGLVRGFWILTTLAALAFLSLALPRMSQSLWVDEDFSIRDAMWGGFRFDEEGEPYFRKQRWERVLYFYETPNNHVPYSAMARVCLDVWQTVTKPEGLQFREWPMRVPALAAGVGTIFALAWCLKLSGWPTAGLLAAFLAALNPWLIRMGSEARGFSWMMLLVVLLACFLQLAVRTGRWRWWAGFGFCQFGIFYVFPAAIYVLVVANLATVATIFLSRNAARPPLPQLGRWFFACAAAGVLVIQLMLPLLPQMLKYLQMDIAQGGVNWPWARNFLSMIFAGAPWTRTRLEVSDYPELWPMTLNQSFLFGFLLVVALLALILGSVRMIRGGAITGSVWAVCLLPGILGFWVARLQNQYLFDRYLLFLLPGAILVSAAGLGWLRQGMRRGGLPSAAATSLIFLPVVLYGTFVWPVLMEQTRRPNNPIRESVLLTRPTLNPYDPVQAGILTGTYSFTPETYDPHIIRLHSPEELIALMERADLENKPLFLNIGNIWSAETHQRPLYDIMTNEALFETVERLPGWDATMDRLVVRYRPGGVRTLSTARPVPAGHSE